MKILITGGAGYIGSATVHLLKSLNYEVVVLDDLSTGFKRLIPEGVKFYEMNLSQVSKIEHVLKAENITSVIHFAASVRVEESVVNPIKYYNNNFVNALNLVQACAQAGVSHFIFSSTAAVYGNVSSDLVSESAPLNPQSPYGASKAYAERMIEDLAAAQSHFKYVILRYFNVAGASLKFPVGQLSPQASHLIKVCSECAVGKRDHIQVFGSDYPTADGTCVRDYIHVDDLAYAHKLALDYLVSENTSQILNCGYEKGSSVLEVVRAFEKVSGKKIKTILSSRRAGDAIQVVASAKKIRSLLGWAPQYNNLELICDSSYKWELSLNKDQ